MGDAGSCHRHGHTDGAPEALRPSPDLAGPDPGVLNRSEEDDLTTWAQFEAADPGLAAAGQRLIDRGGGGQALLATVRGDEPPRIHPIDVAIVGGRLCAFILRSAKRTDLERDGRYALHTHQDPAAPSEFSVRGRASLVESEDVRSAAAVHWSFEVDETYALFEFSIEAALLGARETADEWPPRYSSWVAAEVAR